MASFGSRKGDLVFLTALAAGRDAKDAARQAGISERTCYRRLADPEFRQKLNEARTEMVDRAVGAISYVSVAAVQTLASLLKANSEAVRLGASRSILEVGCKLREFNDLAQRIERLEQMQPESPVIDAQPSFNGQVARRHY